jgi:crossover junction endodeoxyribonuclease RuvC
VLSEPLAARVIGVDPGSLAMGWGVVERRGTRLVHVAHGVLRPAGDGLADRLLCIERELVQVIDEYRPAEGAVESIFFSKNAQSAAKLGHARGVVLLVLRRAGMTVSEYPPAQVKRAVVGRGRADKRQVALVVRGVLSLSATPASDAADALAVALTHLSAQRYQQALGRQLR